jgi:tRNA pseudouridine38-40 synthase
MMLRLGYLGDYFHGFARQPHHRTVEGDLLEALEKIGYTGPVHAASRTDKGVSALCNVVQVDYRGYDICRRLTSLLDGIWVHGYCEENHNPRHCHKHYIYFYRGSFERERVERVCVLCSGIHDFSALSRGAHENTIKEIRVTCESRDPVILFHFYGKSFLWEMIRRCMTAIGSFLSRTITEDTFLQILAGIHDKVPPAPAENLLLAELIYPFTFTVDEYSYERMKNMLATYYENHVVLAQKFEEMLRFLPEKKGKE